MGTNRIPEAPKTFLEPRCCWKLFSELFWALLAPPGTSKIVLSLEREHDFQKSYLSHGEPKSEPKMRPKLSPKRPPEASKWLKNGFRIDALFLSKFQVQISRFWDPKMDPKIDQKSASAPQGSPEAPRSTPGDPQETPEGPQEAPKRPPGGPKKSRGRPPAPQPIRTSVLAS